MTLLITRSSFFVIATILSSLVTLLQSTDPVFEHIPYVKQWVNRALPTVKSFVEKTVLKDPHVNITATEENIRRICSKGNDTIYTFIFSEQPSIIQYADHFPHFSEHFFFAISLKLWLPLINPYNVHTHCQNVRYLYGFALSPREYLFANYHSLHWVNSFVSHMDALYGHLSLVRIDRSHAATNGTMYYAPGNPTLPLSPTTLGTHLHPLVYPKPYGWFLHPGDALTLSAHFLNNSERQLRTIHRTQPLQIILFDRVSTRSFANLTGLAHFLQNFSVVLPHHQHDHDHDHHDNATIGHQYARNTTKVLSFEHNNVTVFYGEKKSLEEQILPVSHADVVVTIHGAGETNFAFMRPCTIVIEIFPWQYHAFNFFASMYTKLNIVHEYWEAARTPTFPAFGMEKVLCPKLFFPFWLEHGHLPVNETSRDLAYKECQKTMCRVCSRYVKAVEVDLQILQEKLAVAFAKQESCLQTHEDIVDVY